MRTASDSWRSYGGYAAADKALEFVNYQVLQEYGRDMATVRGAIGRTWRPV